MYYSIQHERNQQKNFFYKIFLRAGILILILTVPLSFILLVSISFENGIIENFQVIVLIFAGIYNLNLIRQSIDIEMEYFHVWFAVLMFFMAFRELSWGRVFYQIDMEDSGPVFIAMSNYQWKIEAYVIIIAVILFLIYFLLMKLPLMRLIQCRLPILIFILMSVAMIFSYIGDHGLIEGKLHGQIIEEFGELAFYILMPALSIHYHKEMSK